MKTIINGVSFYAGWFIVVLGAAAGRPFIGVVAILGLVAVHLRVVSPRPLAEALLIIFVGLLGWLIDSIYVASGLLVFASPGPFAHLAPFWITALYLLFASSIHHSLSWLRHRPWLSVPMGAVGGPFSYRAGNVLGAVEFPHGVPLTLAVIGLFWLGLFPLIDWIAEKIDARYPNP